MVGYAATAHRTAVVFFHISSVLWMIIMHTPNNYTIQKRNRRKWTAPGNGRSCDSIPKAMAISVDIGLLPPDTEIPSGKRSKRSFDGTSSSSKRGRKRTKRKNDDDADDAAEAAASLLSMVSSRSTAASTAAATTTKNRDHFDDIDDSKDDDEESDKEHGDEDGDDDDDDSDSEDKGPPPVPLDPENTLNVYALLPISRSEATLPSTVHWDPTSPDGRKIGWKVRIETGSSSGESWMDGRVVRYDPHTHKHKIVVERSANNSSVNRPFWIWLRNEQHNLQLATRMVWAHVKGYAWWPALVMESNSERSKAKDGYVLIEFFGTGEISCLRDSPDIVRPFDPDRIDPVVKSHRKKRNQRAFELACVEHTQIQKTRNEAALYYARAALDMGSYYAPKNGTSTAIAGASRAHGLIGRRIQILRSDVNYPYGDTVVGTVRQYSFYQKKWLVSFTITEQQSNKTKYPAAWINLYGKEHSLRVLDKNEEVNVTNADLLPFLIGYTSYAAADRSKHPPEHVEILDLMNSRCRGCVEYLKSGTAGSNPQSKDQPAIACDSCSGTFHLGCVDPPMNLEMWQRSIRDGLAFVCARCTPCRGCYQKDVAFGSFSHPSPPTMLSLPGVSLEQGKTTLDLCSMCKSHYDSESFCPNCAHTWDDKKFDLVRRQLEYGVSGRKRKGGIFVGDVGSQLFFGAFDGDDNLPVEVKVGPEVFYPESSEWGYKEDEMMVCDDCNVWVHAGCAGVDEDTYETISDGEHPIYSKEFLCRMCCRKRCQNLIRALQQEDKTMLFANAVSEKIVPNYHDIIKEPIDLQTMLEKAEREEYLNYAWVRENFELMVANALTFNRYVSFPLRNVCFWTASSYTSYMSCT
jgi:Bromodomain/PWWP domain